MGGPDVKLICFDVGGVLLRVCTSFEEGVRLAGLPVRLESAEMARYFDTAHEPREQYRTGKIDSMEFSRCVSEVFKGIYSAAEVQSILKTWVGESYRETEPMLAALKADANCKVALLSNTCPDHWRQITSYPWMKYVDYAFASHVLGEAKPAPEAFAAVESATRVAAEEILFFDDARENVAVSAERGWNSVHINTYGDISAQIRAALPSWAATSWKRL